MKKALIVLIICSIIISCTKDNDKEDVYNYTFSTKSQLSIESFNDGYMKYATIISGQNLVFEYEFVKDDAEEISDDEYAEYIRFEIDPNLDEFNYDGEELMTMNTVFSKVCYCAFFDETKDVPPTGSISGKKISDTKWDITIDVTFYGDEPKAISGTFKLKE